MIKYNLKFVLALIFFIGCKEQQKNQNIDTEVEAKTISQSAKKVRNYIKKDIVIAHRGTTYWAPEETEPAYLWARNIGADYLEIDVQLTKDNILVAFHDNDLSRTTNVAEVFPERIKSGINDFTLRELQSLDAGSWFNIASSDQKRQSFEGLKIMTLKDVIMIAEGNRIKKKNGQPLKELIEGKWNGKYLYEKDPNDNGNRPGIYVETKHPKLNSEAVLAKEITELDWNINKNPKSIKTIQGKVNIANTKARLILQSFSPESIMQLEKHLPNIPKCLLLWQPDMEGDIKETYKQAIDFAINNNVQIIGPSIAGKPNNYNELTSPWMSELIHNAELLIHSYTFDTNEQLIKYKNRVDAVFTNRADLALEFYNRKSKKSSHQVLIELGY